MKRHFDRIILGGGLYGLYAALKSASIGCSVLVLEYDEKPFTRATFANQARIHQGYHYPRSLHTAIKSAQYFKRFNEDFGFCIKKSFDQVYATSASLSWSNSDQFKTFCDAAGIPCERINPDKFFKPGTVDGAFLTEEYTYDAMILRDHLMTSILESNAIEMRFGARILSIERDNKSFELQLADGLIYETSFLLNATYASTNQVLKMVGLEGFNIKYELCEIALCKPNEQLQRYGFTVMDGPFFSIMPFGKSDYHSLTSVSFTPHETSYESLPSFTCQEKMTGSCSPRQLSNCTQCKERPRSAFPYMRNLASKYLREEYDYTYRNSLFSVKPILKTSEIDDSRPTVIRVHSKHPTLISVLSGKINTMYDLDKVLEYD